MCPPNVSLCVPVQGGGGGGEINLMDLPLCRQDMVYGLSLNLELADLLELMISESLACSCLQPQCRGSRCTLLYPPLHGAGNPDSGIHAMYRALCLTSRPPGPELTVKLLFTCRFLCCCDTLACSLLTKSRCPSGQRGRGFGRPGPALSTVLSS